MDPMGVFEHSVEVNHQLKDGWCFWMMINPHSKIMVVGFPGYSYTLCEHVPYRMSSSSTTRTKSGQDIIFHQPRFPRNKGSHFPSKQLPFFWESARFVRSRANLIRTLPRWWYFLLPLNKNCSSSWGKTTAPSMTRILPQYSPNKAYSYYYYYYHYCYHCYSGGH